MSLDTGKAFQFCLRNVSIRIRIKTNSANNFVCFWPTLPLEQGLKPISDLQSYKNKII